MITFHATQMVAYQHQATSPSENSQQIAVTIGNQKTLNIPKDMQQLQQAPTTERRPTPVFDQNTIQKDWYEGTVMPIPNQATVRDVGWIPCRLQEPNNQKVPAWTGFNQMIADSSNCAKLTTVAFMPLINAPAHENNTLWTVMQRCLTLVSQQY